MGDRWHHNYHLNMTGDTQKNYPWQEIGHSLLPTTEMVHRGKRVQIMFFQKHSGLLHLGYSCLNPTLQ